MGLRMLKATAVAGLWAVLALSGASAQDKALDVDGPEEMSAPLVKEWSREHIEEAPFTYFGFASDHAIYRMDAPKAGDAPRNWVRLEYFDTVSVEGKAYRSAKSLMEFNCADKAWRRLSTDYYEWNGLRGETRHVAVAAPAWEKPEASTNEGFMITTVCAG
jgi:hypothetical protein